MVTIVIVGVNEWERYTLPFIHSIQKYEPHVVIVCVDNGSDIPYPQTDGVIIVRSDKVLPYAAGINLGMKAVKADWYIVSNNDVLLTAPFVTKLYKLPIAYLYGFAQYQGVVADGVQYLSGWLMFISNYVLKEIGYFDEEYKPMYFEDADYSYRCTKAGIPLVCLDRIEWGFYHLEDERHRDRRQYMQKHMDARHRNREYFKVKHGL